MTIETGKRSSGAASAPELLHVIGGLARELHPDLRSSSITLDSFLDRDLGLDSLARMELLARLEQAFAIRLPEQILATAETPRDILRQLDKTTEHPAAGENTAALPETPVGDISRLSHDALTLVEVLERHASSHPDRIHIILDDQHDKAVQITYGELMQGARQTAAGLQQAGLEPGDTAAIILPTGREYFFSFFGILLAGGIPVPLYPPVRPTQIEEHLRRHSAILQNAMVKALITVSEIKPVARLLKLQVASLEKISTVPELSVPENTFTHIPVLPGDVAFLQYTSGSTGDPKGVILTHANLLANIRAMGQATNVTATDVFVSWLPLYHDMGLIGAWLGSLCFGCRLVIMPPLSFLARPERWLKAIHKYGGTLSASPNFGYELCFRRISDSALEGLDLSSWRLAFNGAEPVTPQAITNFSSRFARCGFRKESMAPVYGLAESSVGLAFPPSGRPPLIDRIERDTFVRSGRAVPVAGTGTPSLEFVACGRPLPGHHIRIVDRKGRELPDRREGILQFKGPSATSGYFRSPDKTSALFMGEWLDSGDLAYVADGDIYVTGRIKDIIIRSGRNVYPHELEESVGNIQGIRKGCVAVFGSKDIQSGTERLIVLAESRKKDPQSRETLQKQITDTTVDLLAMPPDEVVIVPPGTILKTSSGKIRRAASRELFENNRINAPKRAVWLQVTRVIVSGFIPQVRRFSRQAADTIYAGYCWFLFGLLSPLAWLLVVSLPGRKARWHVTRSAAKLLALLSGTRLVVRGTENVPRDSPVVFAANHMSYLDAILLQAALPVACSFTAKAELASANPFVRLALSRLGAVLVERTDREQGLENSRQIARMAASGKVFLFFPEGTFQRTPGLLPFRMGAFLTSVEAAIPVIPVTIRGTRSKLRPGTWFPRRGHADVTISKPVLPAGKDWAAALRLREEVRQVILSHLGEPDLAGSLHTFSESVTPRPDKK